MKRIFAISFAVLLLLTSLLALTSCQSNAVYAEIVVKDYGTITLKLDPSSAPETVENFVKLADSGFYEGSPFHRIIEGFMIQGGSSANGETASTIKGEFSNNGVKNRIKHKRGVISMARQGGSAYTDYLYYNTGSSQFFIVHETSPHLDGNYAAFGRVIEGMDVVDAIAAVPTDYNDAPLSDIIIERVTILRDSAE